MNIRLYQSWDELQDLAGKWNALLATSASDSIFLTWEWCAQWWKSYGGDRPLFVLAAFDDAELLGIAPLYLDRVRRWGRGWDCLRVIGDGSRDSDYLDFIIAPRREQDVARSFTEFLQDANRHWDWLQLEGVPEDSPSLAALLDCAAQRQWRSAREAIPCLSLALPASWDEYLKLMRPRFRTKVRSSLGQLEKLGWSPRSIYGAGAELDAWLGELFRLHSERWRRDFQPGVFRAPAKRTFYRELSQAVQEKGWLAFHRLDWGERAMALQYGFRYGNRFYLLQEGYDPNFESLRPGVALRAWLMRYWIGEGLTEYDFLAGTAAHKVEWGARPKMTYRVLLSSQRRGAWVAMDVPRLSEKARERVRRTAPEAVLAWRKEWLLGRKRRRFQQPEQPARPLGKRILRWSASHLYAGTPLGGVARYMASHYTRQRSSDGARLQRRTGPVCHIFAYHRVNDERDPFFYALPTEQFRAQMEHVARHFHFVSLDQVVAGELPSNGSKYCVAVTFDDGYRDNFLYALPILKQMGIPATVFVATGFIEAGRLSWYDQVRLAFKLTTRPRLALGEIGGPVSSLESERGRLEALAQTLNWLRSLDETTRLQSLAEVFRELRVPADLDLPNTMLNWNEICQMSGQGMSIGAHTVTHPVLSSLPEKRLQEEIFGSKKALENRLQSPVRHFAYPFGKQADFSMEAKRVVRAAGFESAVTTIHGVNSPAEDRFELKRFVLREPDMGVFALKLDWARM